MPRVPDQDAPEPDALGRRVPRTDWLLRRRRLVGLPVVFATAGAVAVVYAIRHGMSDGEQVGWAWGGATALLALVFVWASFRVRQAERRRMREKARVSATPWTWHGYWSLEGEKRFVALRPSRVMTKVRRLLEVSGWLALVAAAALYLHRQNSAAVFPASVAGVASLAVVFFTGVRGAANVIVVWRERPGRTGEPVHYSVSVAPMPGGRFDRIDMTLRCAVETSRLGGILRPEVKCPFSATRLFADEIPDAAVTLHARFAVPAGLPPADPYGEPAVFWELLVTAERSGSRFEETFLVPVYASLS